MKYRDQMIKDIYTIAGLLEGLTCMAGHPVTESMTDVLAICVDKLELMGAVLLAKDVTDDGDTKEIHPTP
jgi:hypothetical protein